MNKAFVTFGTRPEATKIAPAVKALEHAMYVVDVSFTGQHRQMLDQVPDIFDVKPGCDLKYMQSGQDLPDVTSNACEPVFRLIKGADNTTSSIRSVTCLLSVRCSDPTAAHRVSRRAGRSPSLGNPALFARNTTERTEALPARKIPGI